MDEHKYEQYFDDIDNILNDIAAKTCSTLKENNNNSSSKKNNNEWESNSNAVRTSTDSTLTNNMTISNLQKEKLDCLMVINDLNSRFTCIQNDYNDLLQAYKMLQDDHVRANDFIAKQSLQIKALEDILKKPSIEGNIISTSQVATNAYNCNSKEGSREIVSLPPSSMGTAIDFNAIKNYARQLEINNQILTSSSSHHKDLVFSNNINNANHYSLPHHGQSHINNNSANLLLQGTKSFELLSAAAHSLSPIKEQQHQQNKLSNSNHNNNNNNNNNHPIVVGTFNSEDLRDFMTLSDKVGAEEIGDFKRGGLRATANARIQHVKSAGPGFTNNNFFFSDDLNTAASGLPTSHNSVPSYHAFCHFSGDKIIKWFENIGLGRYAINLKDSHRTGSFLLNAAAKDISKHLNISNSLHVKKIMVHLGRISQVPSERIVISDSFQIPKWLDDIGLMNYYTNFIDAKIDGFVLNELTLEDLTEMKITFELHITSLRRSIQMLRSINFDLNKVIRRPIVSQEEFESLGLQNHHSVNNTNSHQSDPLNDKYWKMTFSDGKNLKMRLMEVSLWSNCQVMAWLKYADLAEYANHLRASGVHGALLVNESRFTPCLLAQILNIGEEKSLLRRHLRAELVKLLNEDMISDREQDIGNLENPLSATTKVKNKRKRSIFGGSSKNKLSNNGIPLCPLDLPYNASLVERDYELFFEDLNKRLFPFQETSIDQ